MSKTWIFTLKIGFTVIPKIALTLNCLNRRHHCRPCAGPLADSCVVDGIIVGIIVGISVGISVGFDDGCKVGCTVGCNVGFSVGCIVGCIFGCIVGFGVGSADGVIDGPADGFAVWPSSSSSSSENQQRFGTYFLHISPISTTELLLDTSSPLINTLKPFTTPESINSK